MEINIIKTGGFCCNTYIISEGAKAVIIDCGVRSLPVFEYLESRGMAAEFVLLTHSHFDHCKCAGDFIDKGIKIYKYGSFSEKKEIEFNGGVFKIILTPGHTADSLCIEFGDYLFTGDTLFKLSVGRTDLPSGDQAALEESLNSLCLLKKDYIIMPGHGESTTLDYEKKHNPYLKW